MNEEEFKSRTKQLALRVIKLTDALPNTIAGNVIGKQILRSATAVGTNYRAVVCRTRPKADMIAKLGIVEEEADETLFWLEILVESGMVPESRLSDLMNEADEIVAMTVSSIKTLRKKK